jgi:peptidoglycan/xylan/chitin deacetylase (PgdA/CDA1 family)
MNFIPIKTPFVVKELFPNFIWEINTPKKELYLTYDDGPTPEIANWVLKVLSDFNAKATFFCVGKNVEKHPDIFQYIIDQDHTIGNHTHNHIKGWNTKTEDYLTNIEKASGLIPSKLFRPPYGQIKPKQGKKLISMDYKVVMWNVLPFDWDNQVSEKTCLNNVISNTKNGSIIVFHDSIKASRNMQYCLPKVLEHFSEKGFVFKSIEI